MFIGTGQLLGGHQVRQGQAVGHCLIQGKTLLSREPMLHGLNRDRADRGERVAR